MRRPREAGFTLAEVLVAVSILGLSFVALVGGLGTAIITADADRRQAIGQNHLRTLAEEVKAEAYDPCPGTPAYGSSFSAPSTFTKTVSVEYWVALTNLYVPVCPLNDNGLQRVTITLETTDGRVRESMVVFKREA